MKVANEAERERLSEIDHNYMSDEEDGDEEGIWVVRSPSWRSAELSSLLEALQKKVKEKDSSSKHLKNKRMRGANCTRKLPSRPPAWAVSQQRQTSIRQPTAPQHHNSTTASTLRDLENGGRPSLSRKNPQPLTRKRNRPKHPQETRTQDMEDEDSSCRSSSPKSPFLKGKGAHDSD